MTLLDRQSQDTTADLWTELWRHQSLAREAVAEFLDAPTTLQFERMQTSMATYLGHERSIFDHVVDDLPPQQAAEIEEQHARVAAALDTTLWEKPGSTELWNSTTLLRRMLVQQIELTQRFAGRSRTRGA